MRKWIGLGALVAVLISAGAAEATNYKIDGQHTTVSFKIRHLFSKVLGTFNEYEGSFVYEPGNSAIWSAEAVIQVSSIDTGVEGRDKHLRSKDFFDADQFPTITFKSTKVTDVTATSAKLHGDFTLRGITKPIVLDVVIHGEGQDPWGNLRSGLTATAKINRKDFGLTWNETLETGQLLVGENVEIVLEIEGIAQE